jgi:hypothetical protein
VLRPGGRIFVNAPDVDMWTFDTSDRMVTRRIIHYFCDHEVNGWIGRQMPRFFGETGLTDIKALAVNVLIEDYDSQAEIYLSELITRVEAKGIVNPAEGTVWLGELCCKFQEGFFPCSQTFFRVAGQKGQ